MSLVKNICLRGKKITLKLKETLKTKLGLKTGM